MVPLKTILVFGFITVFFLKDKENLLRAANEKTRGLRQLRFESKMDIDKDLVFVYVTEAIANQKAGKEIKR